MLVHLMLELYGCDRQLLSNEPLIRRVLDEYPGRIGMERVSPVHLYDIETSNPLDAGLSGFVVIAQSHISLLIYSYTLLSLLHMRRMIGAPVPFVVDPLTTSSSSMYNTYTTCAPGPKEELSDAKRRVRSYRLW